MVRAWRALVLLSVMLFGCGGDDAVGLTEVLLSLDAKDAARTATVVRIRINAVVLEVPATMWPLELIVEPGKTNKLNFETTAWALTADGSVLGSAMGGHSFTDHQRTTLRLTLDPGVQAGQPPMVNAEVGEGNEVIVQPMEGMLLDGGVLNPDGAVPGTDGSVILPGLDAGCVGSACGRPCAPYASSGCACSEFGGHAYLRCTGASNWSDARKACRDQGSDLVIIDSTAENAWVASVIAGTESWIGANDRGDNGTVVGLGECAVPCRKAGVEGKWTWIDTADGMTRGEALCEFDASTQACAPSPGKLVNWAAMAPDNEMAPIQCYPSQDCPEGQDCAAMGPDGTWQDHECSKTLPFVCESF